jgi:hypothetical protein
MLVISEIIIGSFVRFNPEFLKLRLSVSFQEFSFEQIETMLNTRYEVLSINDHQYILRGWGGISKSYYNAFPSVFPVTKVLENSE